MGGDVGGIGGEGFDFVVFDEDDGVGPDFAAGVPEAAEFDGFYGFRGGIGLCKGNCGRKEQGKD